MRSVTLSMSNMDNLIDSYNNLVEFYREVYGRLVTCLRLLLLEIISNRLLPATPDLGN